MQLCLQLVRARHGRHLATLAMLAGCLALDGRLLRWLFLFEQLFMHSDTPLSLNLLLRALLMLLPHMHDGSSFRPIALVTVEALEVLGDLIGCPPMLAGFAWA